MQRRAMQQPRHGAEMNRAASSAQNAYGQAVDEVRSFASDQPIAPTVGLGVITRGRSGP